MRKPKIYFINVDKLCMYAYVYAQSIALCLSIKNEKAKHNMKSHSITNSNATLE